MRFHWPIVGALFPLGFVFAIGAGGCSTSPRDATGSGEPRSLAQGIQGGAVDTTHTFAVGVCSGPKGNCNGICSGTLILPNLIATARHCVDDTPKKINCAENPMFGVRKVNELWITTHSEMLGQTTMGWHPVKSIVVPSEKTVCGNDLALLVLDDLVPAEEAKPVTPAVQYPLTDERYGRRTTAIGFGITAPDTNTAGTRRSLANIFIACIPGDADQPCPKEVHEREFVSGDGVCEGDSGSGSFDTFQLDTPKAVTYGVLSRGGESADKLRCEGSIYTRLDAFRSMIVGAADAASGNWTLYPKPSPDWTVFVAPTPKDAGTDSGKPSTVPSGLGLGQACTDDAACSSKTCVDDGTGDKVCSKACTDTGNECPSGYHCSANLCFAGDAPAGPTAAPDSGSTSGCAVSSKTPANVGITELGVVGLALALAGRRRSKRRANR